MAFMMGAGDGKETVKRLTKHCIWGVDASIPPLRYGTGAVLSSVCNQSTVCLDRAPESYLPPISRRLATIGSDWSP